MFKLTAVLCVSIYLVMLIFGVEDPNQQPKAEAVAKVEKVEPKRVKTVRPAQVETVKLRALQSPDGPINIIPAAFDPAKPVAPSTVAVLTLEGETPAIPAVTKSVAPAVLAPIAAPQEAAALPRYKVTGGRVNLRAGASTEFDVVGRVLRNEQAEMLEFLPNGWARIKMVVSGQEAYISGDFLSPVGG